jgi:hypothetical protein
LLLHLGSVGSPAPQGSSASMIEGARCSRTSPARWGTGRGQRRSSRTTVRARSGGGSASITLPSGRSTLPGMSSGGTAHPLLLPARSSCTATSGNGTRCGRMVGSRDSSTGTSRIRATRGTTCSRLSGTLVPLYDDGACREAGFRNACNRMRRTMTFLDAYGMDLGISDEGSIAESVLAFARRERRGP